MKYVEYNGKIISGIELADTEFKRILGLMFRIYISSNISMLFDLKESSFASVHTLFVFFPIDVIFLDSDWKIIKVAKLIPFVGFTSMHNTRYVLETKSGTIKKFKLSVGNKLQLKEF